MARGAARAMDKSAALQHAAADAGDAEADFALGVLYLLGRGVEKNLGEAFKRFGRSVDAGDEDAAALRELAAEQLAREQVTDRLKEEAATVVMQDAKRRRRFPKPKLVTSD